MIRKKENRNESRIGGRRNRVTAVMLSAMLVAGTWLPVSALAGSGDFDGSGSGIGHTAAPAGSRAAVRDGAASAGSGSASHAQVLQTPDDELSAAMENADAAAAALEEARQQQTAAQEEVESARASLQQAKEEYEKAAQELREAETAQSGTAQELQAAQEEKEQASQQLQKDKNRAENAKTAAQQAAAKVEKAKKTVAAKREAWQESRKALQSAKDDWEQAKAALQTAEQKASAANEKLQEAEDKTTEAEQDKQNKKTALDKADQESSDAASQYEEADQSYQTAVQKVSGLQSSYNSAKKKYDRGSIGFFESVGASAAKKVLSSCKYKSYIKTRDKGSSEKEYSVDATSLSNMKATLQWLKYYNKLRSRLGLKSVKVTDRMMARAQANADYSDVNIRHSEQFNVGENLAWNGGSNPYEQWYDEEKAEFEKLVAKKYPSLVGTDPWKAYQKHKDLWTSDTGHYLNDINPSYTVTGFAVCTRRSNNDWVTYSQVFLYAADSGDKTYTVSAYGKRLNQYTGGLESTIKQYKAAVKTRDAAAAARQNAAQEKADKTAALTQAKQDYQEALSRYESCQTAQEEAEAAQQEAQEQLTAAQETVDAAQDACDLAEGSEAACREESEQAETELTQAQDAQKKANEEQSAAEKSLQQAQEDYERARTAYAGAAAKDTQARALTEQKREAAETAAAQQKEAETQAAEAEETLRQAEETVQKAEEKNEQAQTLLYALRIDIAAASVGGMKSSAVYRGKAIKPAPRVIMNGTELQDGVDYRVSYQRNRSIGTARITITGIGRFKGSVTRTFRIVPRGTTVKKVKTGKKKLTVTWKKRRQRISGYQIQYSRSRNFRRARMKNARGSRKTRVVLKKLKLGKTYYVRIRIYKKVNGDVYRSAWSKAVKKKVK